LTSCRTSSSPRTSAASGARAASPADARRAIQQALRYVQQSPHVREFLAELIESAPLGMPCCAWCRPAPRLPRHRPPSKRRVGDQSLIASYRDDVKSGRVVCDECSTVIRGARFKCTTCADFDLVRAVRGQNATQSRARVCSRCVQRSNGECNCRSRCYTCCALRRQTGGGAGLDPAETPATRSGR
jgi:hypothetical protein